MSRLKGAAARLRSMLFRRGTEARMEEEFRFHMEMETEKNIRLGMPPAEARRRSRLAFGGADRYGEGMRDGWGLRWLLDVRQDVRFALRSLGRTPVFAVIGVGTIALGVGVTTALFSMANAVLLRELPLPSAEQVVTLQEFRRGMVSNGIEGERIPLERYVAYREGTSEIFAELAAHRTHTVSLRTRGDALPVKAVLYGGDYFSVLGLSPALGRLPDGSEDDVVVLSDEYWQTHFGGAPDVIGGIAWIDGRPHTVTAVASPRFRGTVFGLPVDVWIPLESYAANRSVGFEHWVTPVGRLRPGLSLERALSGVEAAAARIPQAEAHTRIVRIALEPLGGLYGQGRRIATSFMALLVGAALLVLMIAAANIAGMLLARALARQREIAVRLAIGAGRLRLIRQLLTESVLLFLLGGAGGILLAFWLTTLLGRVQAPAPGVNLQLSATPDLRVLGFALLVSVVPALLFGLLPALQVTRPQLVPELREGSPGSGVRSVRLRSIFVAGQLALAVLLLVCAGLFTRSLRHGLTADYGFDRENVVVASVNLTPHGYEDGERDAFFEQLTSRMRAAPGVISVALARWVLLAGESHGTTVRALDAAPDRAGIAVRTNTVDTAYFSTLRVPLLAGRGFLPGDVEGAPEVAVINETLARRLWPELDPSDAIGKTFGEGSRTYTIAGVARNGLYVEITERPTAFVFLPHAQRPAASMVLHVRSDRPASDVVSDIRMQVRALDPNVALDYARPLSSMTEITLFPQRFAATLVGIMGMLGLLLAAIGVYGVLMYHVAQRRHEFGVRLALGASTSAIARAVMSRSLVLTGAGLAVGLTAAWFAARFLASMIFGVSTRDPVTFVTVPVVLAAFALAASLYPALRAGRADPMQVLRSD
jgi:predicted permease